MTTPQQIAKHFREIHFGGNWTCSNVKDNLAGITWQQATTKVSNFNTIAILAFHMNYFVEAALRVLEGNKLNASDKLSFNHPPIHNQNDWEKMVNKTLNDAEKFAALLEKLPEEKLWQAFEDEKYGTYYRNMHGIIEHTHYHLGQLVIIKKMVEEQEKITKA